MHFTRASLNVLALVGLSARLGAAQTAAASLTAQRLVSILETQGGNPNIQSKPNPTDPPNFQYNFNAQFHSSCTLDQREAILFTVKNIAGLADRVQLWETDAFHDWQDEVSYWFGDDSAKYDTYIKSEAPQKFVLLSKGSLLKLYQIIFLE